jgi:hypothetical protein
MRTIDEVTSQYCPIAKRIDYSAKGYDVSVFRDENDEKYTVDIKYPCGELIRGWSGIDSQRNAVHVAVCYIHALDYYKHDHCDDEYCRGAA